MRGVPRERRAISAAPAGSVGMPRMAAERSQMLCRSSAAVVLQPLDDAEAVAQRRGQEPGAGGRPDQGKGRQVELDGAGGGPVADHDVELVVLHGRVEDLLHHRAQAMDLVHEQDVPGLQVGQQRGEIPGLLDHRPRGLAQVDPHLVGDDVGQGGLAEPRGTEDQDVVQGLAALAGGADEDLHLLAHRRLADIIRQAPRADRAVQGIVLGAGLGADQALGIVHKQQSWGIDIALGAAASTDSGPAHAPPPALDVRLTSSRVPRTDGYPSSRQRMPGQPANKKGLAVTARPFCVWLPGTGSNRRPSD